VSWQAKKVSLTAVSLIVDKPDIILVEHMDSLETNALVLNMEIEATVLVLPEALDVSGAVSRLHIFSCVLDPAVRRATTAEVLSPCRLTLKAKVSDEDDDRGTQVDVSVSDVTLSVSPGTCEMLANISKSLTVVAEPDDAACSAATPEPLAAAAPDDWSDVWDVKPIDRLALPFLAAEEAEEVFELGAELDEAAQVDEEPQRREQLILVLGQLTVVVEAGVGNRTSPLIMVESGVGLQVGF